MARSEPTQAPPASAPPQAGAPPHPGLAAFHPLIQGWFADTLGEPTEPQLRGWPELRAGHDVLITAPTGSGKTLTAFLSALDGLWRDALAGTLEDRTRVLYVSPLKALGNDVQKNLLQPLEDLRQRAREAGLSPQELRISVRTGDTPASERDRMLRHPPHVLITTPESLYLCLTAGRTRELLRDVRTVIVDEIHALARDRRGSHFALSLERLKALCTAPPQLVGLSATVRPLEDVARFLTGREEGCRRVEVGHVRPWDLTLWVPDRELSAVATHEMWGEAYDALLELAGQVRTTLVFVNTRRLAERVAHDLGERLGEGRVAAHHGSMSRQARLLAEERLKSGELSVMVATASLELGIDIGNVDAVVQLGSPRSVNALLQRVGRAGHHKAGISRGLLMAMTRDELAECAALLAAVREKELDRLQIPELAMDVLSQQVVAACAAEEWDEEALFRLMRGAWPYRNLTREAFEEVLVMLSEGVSTRRGRNSALLHRDRVNGRLRPRRSARMAALMNGGAIPDTFTVPVRAEPDARIVGTVDEDFAVETMPGDVFLLGSTSWRVMRVAQASLEVEDAQGAPPSVPFWRGEAPGRTDALSRHVSLQRETLPEHPAPHAHLTSDLGLTEGAAGALMDYLAAGAKALGAMPTQTCVVAERFFDEAGGMQLVIHAPFGSRINRAWGYALRKRFCRSFDFELQAAATEDGILLSLSEQHSFPLADIFDFLHPDRVEEVLVQAVLQVPLFGTRFRWVASRALAMQRVQSGKRVPPALQRARAEDLLASVFPEGVGCQDNHGGEDVVIPDHPLVRQAMDDCLREAMDVDGLKAVLRGIREGRIQTLARDLPEPSVFAHQMLNSQPYTFLDGAPLEERRTRAVALRRTLSPEDAVAFGALDDAAIAQVVEEAWPPLRDPDELHDALLGFVALPEDRVPQELVGPLQQTHRAGWVQLPQGRCLVATERLAWLEALHGPLVSESGPPAWRGGPVPGPEEVMLALVRGLLEVCGPMGELELAARVGLTPAQVAQALARMESDGQAVRGTFRAGADGAPLSEWCDRSLLQRIHRLTVGRLRREVEPLSSSDHMRFLFRWHHLEEGDRLRGPGGLARAVALLQGVEAPAAAWESALLPARVERYTPDLLEQQCWAGEVVWGRLTPREPHREPGPARHRRASVAPQPEVEVSDAREAAPVRPLLTRAASLTFALRRDVDVWLSAARQGATEEGAAVLPVGLSHAARDVAGALEQRGACFFAELVSRTRRLPVEVEDALWELLAHGVVTADAVQNLRVLQSPQRRRRQKLLQRGGPGRWSLLRPLEPHARAEVLEQLVRLFLQRWGILLREVVAREPLAPPWRELLPVLRKLEARGELRGGRFVGSVAGEQYALPEAVELARAVRRSGPTGSRVRISAVDPLNLTGVVLPGARVPSQLGQWLTFVDGALEEVPEGSIMPPAEEGAEADPRVREGSTSSAARPKSKARRAATARAG